MTWNWDHRINALVALTARMVWLAGGHEKKDEMLETEYIARRYEIDTLQSMREYNATYEAVQSIPCWKHELPITEAKLG